jgi:hypothetical protein
MASRKVDWAAYDKSLKKRGSITFWMSDEAIKEWSAKPTGKRGAQPKFSDLAIETALSLRLVFKQGLRQTEGLVESIFEMMNVDLDVPDHSTLSRRGKVINISSKVQRNPNEGLVVIVDSTGLKFFGAGEWSETKHGLSKRREWRKLHLSIDESTLEVIVSSLTDNHVGDPTEAEKHLDEIEHSIDELMGDGAYDSKKIYEMLEGRDDGGDHAVTIPPPKNAVVSDGFSEKPTQRDKHVDFINNKGRTAWECKIAYYRRLLVENAMSRFKGIIGSVLRSKNFESQKNETALGCKILNKMVRLGTPLRPLVNPC